jgi:anti-sigma factor RsiW
LLPAYVEGDLTPEEKGRVDAHLGDCEECRESLAFFASLEKTLIERRHERPSDRAAARRIARRLGYRWSLAPYLGGLPAAASLAFIGLGIALFIARDAVRDFFARVGSAHIPDGAGVSETVRGLIAVLESVSAGSAWTWPLVYVGCLALIFLSGTWMVLRWVRD